MISNMHCEWLHFVNFKGNFLNILILFAPSNSRFSNSCISAKYCQILTNHTSMESFIQLSYDIWNWPWFKLVLGLTSQWVVDSKPVLNDSWMNRTHRFNRFTDLKIRIKRSNRWRIGITTNCFNQTHIPQVTQPTDRSGSEPRAPRLTC